MSWYTKTVNKKIIINIQSETPIFQQIVDGMENFILTGKIVEEEFLPSVRDFAVTHSINPNTVSKAYQILQTMGLVEMVRGTGLKVKKFKLAYAEKRKTEIIKLKAQELILLSHSLKVSTAELLNLIKNLDKEK